MNAFSFDKSHFSDRNDNENTFEPFLEKMVIIVRPHQVSNSCFELTKNRT